MRERAGQGGGLRVERISNLYPKSVKIVGDIANGKVLSAKEKGVILNGNGAIEISILVDSSDYPKEDVYQAVKEISLKAAEYFR